MIRIEVVGLGAIPDFTVSDGKITAGSANRVWCDNTASIGEFGLVASCGFSEENHLAKIRQSMI